MERGYVKLWRKILDSGLMQNPTALQLFMYLLLETTHKPRRFSSGGVIVDLKPGDAIFSRIVVGNKLKMSERSARTALDFLKRMEIVTTKATNRFTVVSFVNWDAYQQDKQIDRPAICPTVDQQLTNSCPTGDHCFKNVRIKECKNINTPPLPPKGEPVCVGEQDTPSPSSTPTPKQKPKRKPAGTGNSRTELLALVELYTRDPALRQSLTSFVMMRQHNHHPLTGDGLKKLLSKLDRLAVTGADKVAIVDQSIMLSWRGFFPLREDNANDNHQPRAKPDGAFDMERQTQTMREVYAELMEDRNNDTATRFGNSEEIGSHDSIGSELWQGLPQGSCKNVDSFAGAI